MGLTSYSWSSPREPLALPPECRDYVMLGSRVWPACLRGRDSTCWAISLTQFPTLDSWFLLGVFSSPWCESSPGSSSRRSGPCWRSCPPHWPLRSCSHSAAVGASSSKALFLFLAKSVFSPRCLWCVSSPEMHYLIFKCLEVSIWHRFPASGCSGLKQYYVVCFKFVSVFWSSM